MVVGWCTVRQKFKSPDMVLTRADRVSARTRTSYLWKALITSYVKMSAILSLVCQEVQAINEKFQAFFTILTNRLLGPAFCLKQQRGS